MSTMQLIYLIFMITFVSLSFWRFRSFLHPHVIFTIIICYMWMTDYILRGDETKEFLSYTIFEILPNQILLLVTLTLIFIISFFMASDGSLKAGLSSINLNKIDSRLAFIPIGLITLDIFLRLYTSDFDFFLALESSFGRRYGSPWAQEMMNATTIGSIFRVLAETLKLSGMALAYFIFQSRGLTRTLCVIYFLIAFALIVGTGSRTPVVLSLATVSVMAMISLRSMGLKIAILALIVSFGAVALSAQLLTRSYGGISGLFEEDNTVQVGVVYHQDNNFYLTIRAMIIAEALPWERWNKTEYAKLIVLQPIPRSIYPSKPTYTDEFMGPYGQTYLTLSVMGDGTALFGPLGGMIYGAIICLSLFYLMSQSSRLIPYKMGFLMYMAIILYSYMVMRSSLNLTFFITFPLAVGGLFFLANWGGDRLQRPASRGQGGLLTAAEQRQMNRLQLMQGRRMRP